MTCTPGVDEKYCRLREKFLELERAQKQFNEIKEKLDEDAGKLGVHIYGEDLDKIKKRILEKFLEDEVRKQNINVQLRSYSGEINVGHDEIRKASENFDFSKLFPVIKKLGGESDTVLREIMSSVSNMALAEGSVKNGRAKFSRSDERIRDLSKFLQILHGGDPKLVSSDGVDMRKSPELNDPNIAAITEFKDTVDITFKDKILAKKIFTAVNFRERRNND